MNKYTILKIQILYFNLIIIFLIPIQACCQLGSSGVPGPSPNELMTEALHQAIGLEKLPDVTTLLNSDTIFIEVYDMMAGADSISDEVLSGMLPRHIDKWWVKSINKNTINQKNEDFHYLKMYIKKDKNVFMVNFICQPNHKDFIDRGRLNLVFEYDKGVFTLIKLSRGYG